MSISHSEWNHKVRGKIERAGGKKEREKVLTGVKKAKIVSK